MKVVLFSAGFLDYMICLANALCRHVDVSLVLPERVVTAKHRSLIDPGVRFLPFDYVDYSSVRQNFKMLRSVLGIIRQERPDIVHIQSNGFRLFWLLYPFLKRSTIVNTVHDPSPHSGDLLTIPLPQAERAAAIHCKAFFVHGEALVEELRKTYSVPLSMIHTIPMGEFSFYKNWRTSTIPTRRDEFLFFGRIWPYKGLDVFIEAANRVAERLPRARFIIAGAGEDIGKYVASIESPERFEIRNVRIGESELDEVFQRCFAVVLPYKDATQSAVIPTAYAYGKPVIATRVGALPEVVQEGKTGYLVEPGSPETIADRMVRMSSEPETYNALCDGALRFAREELDWNLVALKTVAVYRRLLDSRAAINRA